ncbi:MAG: hypothetical protein QOJ40_274 [Verrucomicrobiota bacterium]
MKTWLVRGVVLAVLVVAGIWGWRILFPSPEQVIRKRLIEIARVASFSGKEGSLTKLSKVQKLSTFCTSDVEITVEWPGHSTQSLSGREEVLQAAAGLRSMIGSLMVEFLDTTVTVQPGQPVAFVHLTLKCNVSGERDYVVQELKLTFKKINGDWLISRAETVKTLR